MKWISSFFNDLGGSVIGGSFYSRVLSYSPARCWRHLLIFLFFFSLVMTIFLMRVGGELYDRGVNFLRVNNYEVVFENGVISNMPNKLKLISVEDDTMAVWQWIQEWSVVDSLRREHPDISIYIGPEGIFSYTGVSPRATLYPEDLTVTVNAEYFENLRQGYTWLAFLAIFAVIWILSVPWAVIAIFIFIVPILALKFSRMGMRFGQIWKLGLFLVSFHFIYFAIVTILHVNIPYAWIFNFPIYILVVTMLVRIDANIPESPERRNSGGIGHAES
jgi:hypothetical protein